MDKKELLKLSKEALIEIIMLYEKRIVRLERKLESLTSISKELPSFIKPNVEKKEPKPLGAKEGHEGVTRPMPEKVDEKKELRMKMCPFGHKITKLDETRKRTIEDIELIRRTKVIEYTLRGYYCKRCKKKIFPNAPNALSKHRFSISLCNYICERKFKYRMSYNLIQKDLHENFGMEVSQASLVNAVRDIAKLLGSKYENYKKLLRKDKSINIDETGWRVAGTSMYLWKFRGRKTVVTVITWKRSHDVPEEIIGKKYKGIVTSDGLGAYNLLDCKKQRCWAHMLRHAKKAAEKYPTESTKKFHEGLKNLYKQAKESKKSAKTRKLFEHRLKRLLCRRFYNPDTINLKKFMLKHIDELFVFVEERIDGTNNAAEQAIRNDVVIRKISGGNRSAKGRHDYEVLSSVMQTCQLRNENFSDVVSKELETAYG